MKTCLIILASILVPPLIAQTPPPQFAGLLTNSTDYTTRGSSPEMGLYLGIWNSTQLTALATYVKCVDPEI